MGSAYRMFQRFFSHAEPTASVRNLVRLDLINALQQPSCSLCYLAHHKSLRYVETLLDTAVIDVEKRDAWRHAKGLCHWHGHMATHIPQSHSSLAMLYEDLLQHEMDQLDPLASAAPASYAPPKRRKRLLARRIQRWLQSWQQCRPCPVCQLWSEQERLHMTVLLHDWHEPTLQGAFAQSSGLCVSHMARLIAHGSSHVHLPAVLMAQRERLHILHDELREFIRKQDYRFAREPYGSEADAWRRVVDLFVGTRWFS